MKRVFLILTSLITLAAPLLTMSGTPVSADSGFQAGRVVDDNIFFNINTLNANDIQEFLNSKVPACDTSGTQMYNGMTRAAYSATQGYSTPFTCLKDYRQDTSYQPATAYCTPYYGGTNQSSAQIIYDISQDCGVNPEVLIVLLQKEQSLVTDDWPWSIQYQRATGYACPDSGPCDSQYYGFFNQLYNAASQFKRYGAQPNSYSYASGRNNYIQYNPNTGCSGSTVFVQDQSTADLYNYTPYQPDAAALANINGTGDSCSSYGNLNFWQYFNEWFGSTTSNSFTNTLNFVRLNHYSGEIEVVGYSSIGGYGYATRDVLVPYPADPSVIPVFRPNGDLSLIKLDDPSGKVLVTTFGAASNFQQLSSQIYVPYPAVPNDGNVIPEFRPSGDLSFIRLNHYSGHVEVVTYGFNGYFQQLSSIIYVPYPAVPGDGEVVPLFRPSGDLSFIRLNHYSGHVEVVTYGFNGYFQQLSSIILSAYPAVTADGSVRPLFQPNGDLSFVRMNYWGGSVQVVTNGFNGYFQQTVGNDMTRYPAITDFGNVKSILSP